MNVSYVHTQCDALKHPAEVGIGPRIRIHGGFGKSDMASIRISALDA